MIMAEVAQLAEHQFCKLAIAGSSPALGSFGQPFGHLGTNMWCQMALLDVHALVDSAASTVDELYFW